MLYAKFRNTRAQFSNHYQDSKDFETKVGSRKSLFGNGTKAESRFPVSSYFVIPVSIAQCDAAAEVKVEEAKPPANPDATVKPELVLQAEKEEEGTIKSPGPYEYQGQEVKAMLNPDTHDGFRMEVQKVLTPTFVVNHSFWLGAAQMPSNCHYAYTAQVAEGADRGIMARRDSNGGVVGQVTYGLSPKCMSKWMMQLGPQANMDSLSVETVYSGESFTGGLKLVSASSAGVVFNTCYMQAITPKFSAGGDCNVNLSNSQVTSSGAAKYTTPKWGAVVQVHTGGAVTCQYIRKVAPNRVTLGAELEFKPMSMESNVAFGAEFALKQSRVIASIDGTGKISSVLETVLNPAVKLSFCGEIQHATDKYQFGYGLTIGG
mmetsp:Transcript_6912/g.10426  ORF Transcript_6912/g.10426 Transcript_6912/m.10426 type:complete len:375 (-) Transcript_6912:135-1259(-)|eukprot:CAMPEP_0113936496 /NCGR_PEP_ID=MMETSP1339-20121228/3404_1 /TAXON_ID=94617 /ORGANISM="Fibrocapsa japonica" /LENGTH=374 /DNA_ID=CAMNT_0000938999 /DNA_START=131 /DNA_END=1255 /DNA_ORIENTATION=+ /assembly_acc=CAM_ASM_000762